MISFYSDFQYGIFEVMKRITKLDGPDVSIVEQQVGAKRLRVGIEELSV